MHQDMPGVEWSSMRFSSDGKVILVVANTGQIILLDAFSGNELHRLTVCCFLYIVYTLHCLIIG